MEERTQASQGYDFRKYDQVWKRVGTQMEPYSQPAATPSDQAGGMSAPAQSAAANQGQTPSLAQEEQLPGAFPDPCCMGSAVAEMTSVISGFIEEECSARRSYRALLRQAPAMARQTIRDLAGESAAAARRLMAVYYLITGNCYRPAVECGQVCVESWCPALREQYHIEACNGMNYQRAAEGTTDPCLQQLLTELSQDAYGRANRLLYLLQRAIC